MIKIRVAVNLLNYKSFQMGGVESFIKDLLRGFLADSERDIEIIYLVNEVALPRFRPLVKNFEGEVVKIYPDNPVSRTILQKIKLRRILNRNRVDVFFSPQPFMPISIKNSDVISVFHDFQHKDIPENFSLLQRLWRRYKDTVTIKNSDVIVTISEFTKAKLIKNFDFEGQIEVIPNTVQIKEDIPKERQMKILNAYNLNKNEFYYTVSSSAKHKNLSTLVRVFNEFKEEKLLITGPKREEHEKLVDMKSSNVKFTGYIEELDKNVLMKNCKAFLFPSTYEGFGRPPVEALLHGQKVITTNEASIPEVTLGIAKYVRAPYDVSAWIDALESHAGTPTQKEIKALEERYRLDTVSHLYLNLFEKCLT